MIRIKVKDLNPYEKKGNNWVKVNKDISNILNVVKLFKSHRKLNVLIDTKDPRFLKGQLSDEGREQGARINVLPNGAKLEKAYSLFSPHLRIHDQDSHDHWDVLYQNKGGTWSYVYTLKKRKEHRNRKYKKVVEFDKHYNKLVRNVTKNLNESDVVSLAMFTLLNTYMRVGNEIYYKAHKHKGLTTLKKEDVKIKGKNVTFNYVGKDGVPINIDKKFSEKYTKKFSAYLRKVKKGEFIFAKNGHPLREHYFKEAFLKYCGKEFYPHIVRSHHATTKVKKFLAKNKKFDKEKVEELFMSIAHDLGHKKFDKKKNVWKDHYTVTVNSYIQPELVEKVKSRVK